MKRITDGKPEHKPQRRALGPEARTWLIAAGCILVAGFFVIPLMLKNAGGANAVFVMAESERAVPITPEPFSFDVSTPEPLAVADDIPEPTSSIQISEYLQLQLDDDYPSVEHLQTRLMELGYLDSDEPTTEYGSATAAAVSLFQRTLDYEMTGVADIELQENLFSQSAVPYEIKLGDSGSDVEGMQFAVGNVENGIHGNAVFRLKSNERFLGGNAEITVDLPIIISKLI